MDSLSKGFAAFKADFGGKLDICVPCAGINKNVSFLDTSFEQHQQLLGVNVLGVYHTAQFAAKQMIENKTKCGSIIMVASIASYMAIRSQLSSAYCGSKGAVRAMCPAIAAELVPHVRPLHRSCFLLCEATVTMTNMYASARESESIRYPLDMSRRK